MVMVACSHNFLKTEPCDFFDCQGSSIEAYFCKQCNYITNLFQCLELHTEQQHILVKRKKWNKILIKCHKCAKCPFETYSRLMWLIHKKRKCMGRNKTSPNHEDSNKHFKCAQCKFRTKTAADLKRHICRQHLPNESLTIYECTVCKFKTKYNNSFVRHMETKHIKSEELHECSSCSFKCSHKSYLQNHVSQKHPGSKAAKNVAYEVDILTGELYCKQCEYKSKGRCTMLEHVKRQHTPDSLLQWFYCDQCLYKSKEKRYLQRHFNTKHLPANHITWYHCDQCDYKAKFRHHLKRHLNCQHLSDDNFLWFNCNVCGLKLKNNYNLKIHMKRKHQLAVPSVSDNANFS